MSAEKTTPERLAAEFPGAVDGAGHVTIEPHGDAEALYIGRTADEHGLNICRISEPSHQWPEVRAWLLSLPKRLADAEARIADIIARRLADEEHHKNHHEYEVEQGQRHRAALAEAENRAAAAEVERDALREDAELWRAEQAEIDADDDTLDGIIAANAAVRALPLAERQAAIVAGWPDIQTDEEHARLQATAATMPAFVKACMEKLAAVKEAVDLRARCGALEKERDETREDLASARTGLREERAKCQEWLTKEAAEFKAADCKNVGVMTSWCEVHGPTARRYRAERDAATTALTAEKAVHEVTKLSLTASEERAARLEAELSRRPVSEAAAADAEDFAAEWKRKAVSARADNAALLVLLKELGDALVRVVGADFGPDPFACKLCFGKPTFEREEYVHEAGCPLASISTPLTAGRAAVERVRREALEDAAAKVEAARSYAGPGNATDRLQAECENYDNGLAEAADIIRALSTREPTNT